MIEKGINKKKALASEVLGRKLSRKEATSTIKDDPVDLKKGDKVQHIGVKFDKLREGQIYVTANDYDNKLYEAFLSLNLKSKGYDPLKITLNLSEDLKAPSSKSQRDIFDKFYSNNKKMVDKDLKTWADSKDKKLGDNLYDDFMNSLEKSSDSQKMFYKELKNEGYNAVLDEHDITGSWMQGKTPLIIMEQLSTISDFKVEPMNVEKMANALDEWLELKSK